MLCTHWLPPAPLTALTVAIATITLIAPATASADSNDTAAGGTQVIGNSAGGTLPAAVSPGVNAVNVNAPAASNATADDTAAAPSAASSAINPADPNPPNIPGQVILGDGFVYQGSLRNGMPDGRGVKRWPSGDWVAGDFAEGLLEGNAAIHHSDGGTLTGTFKRNAPWDAVEKDVNGNVIAMYQGGVMRAVTQTAAPAQGGAAPAVQQVHSGTAVSNQ